MKWHYEARNKPESQHITWEGFKSIEEQKIEMTSRVKRKVESAQNLRAS